MHFIISITAEAVIAFEAGRWVEKDYRESFDCMSLKKIRQSWAKTHNPVVGIDVLSCPAKQKINIATLEVKSVLTNLFVGDSLTK